MTGNNNSVKLTDADVKVREHIAANLNALMSSRNVTRIELSEAVGTTAQSIANYIGGYAVPRLGVLVKIADYFGVSVDYLLTGVEAESNKRAESALEAGRRLGLSKEAAVQLADIKAHGADKSGAISKLLADKRFYKLMQSIKCGVGDGSMFDALAERISLKIRGAVCEAVTSSVNSAMRN